MISHATPVDCPYCGARHEFSTGLCQDELFKPEEGAITICINCAKASVFTAELKLRKPTPEESICINADPRIVQAQILMSGYERSAA